jgi:hypothetical protein
MWRDIPNPFKQKISKIDISRTPCQKSTEQVGIATVDPKIYLGNLIGQKQEPKSLNPFKQKYFITLYLTSNSSDFHQQNCKQKLFIGTFIDISIGLHSTKDYSAILKKSFPAKIHSSKIQTSILCNFSPTDPIIPVQLAIIF